MIDKSPPEEPTPVAVDWPDVLAVEVFRDRTTESLEVRWIIALIVAVLGLLLLISIPSFMGSQEALLVIFHQIVFALGLLILVVAIKR